MVGNSLGPCVFLWPDVQNVLGVLPVLGLARREGGREGGGREEEGRGRGGKEEEGEKVEEEGRGGGGTGGRGRRKRGDEGKGEEAALLRKAVQTMCACLPTLLHGS